MQVEGLLLEGPYSLLALLQLLYEHRLYCLALLVLLFSLVLPPLKVQPPTPTNAQCPPLTPPKLPPLRASYLTRSVAPGRHRPQLTSPSSLKVCLAAHALVAPLPPRRRARLVGALQAHAPPPYDRPNQAFCPPLLRRHHRPPPPWP